MKDLKVWAEFFMSVGELEQDVLDQLMGSDVQNRLEKGEQRQGDELGSCVVIRPLGRQCM